MSEPIGAGRRVVCLGEALVDLVCEQPATSLAAAQAFVPRVGGSLANIAVVAARFGARVELVGAAGDDEWGRWLRDRIGAEGVGMGRFSLVPGVGTSHAFVAVSHEAEPSFAFYSDRQRPLASAGIDLESALSGPAGVLVLGSDTLLAGVERALTTRAAEVARRRDWIVLCDPNLRPARWSGSGEMLEAVRALVADADVVKCNAGEVLTLTGHSDPERGAGAMLAAGPRVAVVTRGAAGALFVNEQNVVAVSAAEPVAAVDATGAGDAVAGVLAAALAAGVEPADLGRALPVAMQAAAGVIGAWGATTALPTPTSARAAIEAIL